MRILETIVYPTTPTLYVRESQVVSPSQMIAIGDSLLNFDQAPGTGPLGETCWGWGDLSDTDFQPAIWVQIGITSPQGDSYCVERATYRLRHGGRFNIGFCDAHVENLQPADLFDWRKDNIRKRWNRDNLPHPEPFPPAGLHW